MQVGTGKSVLNGIAIGKLKIYKKKDTAISAAEVADTAAEVARFEEAQQKAIEQQTALYEKALAEAGEDIAEVFNIHAMMLEDDDFVDAIKEIINSQKKCAEYAVKTAGNNQAAVFAAMDDPYLQARSAYHISVKGGRFLEAVAQADTVVFDKTGTLTYAVPTVQDVVPFGGHDAQEMLRLAACLEEHYPHSMATAVVEEAKHRGLSHEEYHSQVQYIVAHGISSMVNGEKTLIGSAHFVFEDEGCTIPAGEQERFDALPTQYSHLYLCLAGQLAAVICIHDPLRAEAKDAIRALHDCGIRKVVMMTGDNRRTAACVAEEVGVDEFHAEVLPEDKADFIRRERAAGHTVIMIGDGVNDSPALSEADAGIAISTGAAIAREISDITITSEDLFQLVTLRRISQSLMDRIHRNYRFIVGFNLGLILLGVAGILPPTTSALLHNASTLGISLKSMTDLLPEPEAAATVPERSGE